jgi:hypothetical protein
MKVSTILDRIDNGSIALPEFQRGYVWSRPQVRKLMRSLYRGYPVGSLLMWETETDNADARGVQELAPGVVNLLLDGQQRITSLYGIIRGEPPAFFEGDANRFLNLYFNLKTEEFEFYGPVKMRDDPNWLSVTEVMKDGVGQMIGKIAAIPEFADDLQLYIDRLNRLGAIKERDLHVDVVTGEDKTVDIVVDIFNEVNSGGTKLSKGDLALAKVCASWPDARNVMQDMLTRWEEDGFGFKLDWLMRCVNAVVTGEALFSALDKVETRTFREGLYDTEQYINTILNMIGGRLGLDHDRVLGSVYSFPLITRYLHERDGHLEDFRERDRLLFWYVHTILWGRYSGSTESTLNKDLAAIEVADGALERLINQLYQDRGDLTLYDRDFEGWSRGARFYPMLYMMTRVWHARDWESGLELTAHLLGRKNRLQVHHIFPKARLYDLGRSKPEVNAIANFTFLTQDTNLLVSDREPLEYLEEYAAKHPGAIESHWIPMDRELWRLENYLDFLPARRELLAQAANEFLDSLAEGMVPEPEFAEPIAEPGEPVVLGGVATDEEEENLIAIAAWVEEQGLASGELLHQIVDENTGELLAIVDLAWPKGLQEGLTEPVALLLDEEEDLHNIVQLAGFRFFTSWDTFYCYVEDEILELDTVETV